MTSMEDHDEVAARYDRETRRGLNALLAGEDGLFFNHVGVALPGESAETLKEGTQDEDALLRTLHRMERNGVVLAMHYLGAPRREMLGLDAGCGAGGCAIMLHQASGARIEGFTLSRHQAAYGNAIAQRYGVDDRVWLQQGDMLDLPREDGTYDFVWAYESTEHVPDLDGMFAEFSRVAKPSSRLVVVAGTAHEPAAKRAVDEHYIMHIHRPEEYEDAAPRHGWQQAAHLDLTERLLPYWELRKQSTHATGIEDLVHRGLVGRVFQYHLFGFTRE